MRRRDFITPIGGAAVSWPATVGAQQKQPLPTVGYLGLTSGSGERDLSAPFLAGLKESGFDEGRDVSITYRCAEGDAGRLPALCAELVQSNVAVIFTGTTVATVAARKTTSALPIVFAIGSDPVHLGLVSSLNHPGGNITGISFFTNQMEGKRLGLLHEIAPKAQSIGVLLNPNNPFFDSQLKDVTDTSRVLRVNIHIERATSEREVKAAFQAFGQQALLVGSDLFFFSRRAFVIEQAERFRLAGI
jgi:putative tryptophan/tyrosine transport system substrate-binding protein